MQQNATDLEVLSESGLTPIQEQAAILLASGESVSSVSQMVGVNRSTLYLWQQKVTFQCFFNQQHQEAKSTMINSLFGLYGDAIQVLRDSLQSHNQNIRLKAAMAIIERVHSLPIGEVDAREVLKKQCTTIEEPFGFANLQSEEVLDEKKYKKLLEENGLM